MSNKFTTALGHFDKQEFDALTEIREASLDAIRERLKGRYREVTTASLVNIAGSCENPYSSLPVNYYGREAHLSQSAQLQLESLVLRLRRGFFTINNSFREEHYDDPEQAGRHLSEFTLIEPEGPFSHNDPEKVLSELIEEQARLVSEVLLPIAKKTSERWRVLVPDYEGHERYLLIDASCSLTSPRNTFYEGGPLRITYDKALEILNSKGGQYAFGSDLRIKEERTILKHFDNLPVFVTHFPASLKFLVYNL